MTNRARPRWETKPTSRSKMWQRELFAGAAVLGTPMMPWQKKAGRLLAELRDELCECHDPPRPLPRRKTVVASVCRQQGKSVLSRAAIFTKATLHRERLHLFGTAQSRQYAARHVVALGDHLGSRVETRRGVGNESVTWPETGTTYLPVSPTEGGGHGDSIDFMLVDEAWKVSSVTLGGITPAMIARPHSQMLIISTMGTVDSHVWNGIVAEGRDQVDNPDADIAYLEYSAEDPEWVFDETKWHQWMPALGITVSKADIRAAMRLLEAAEGRAEVIRAFGNVTVAQLVTVFPTEWVRRAVRAIEPPSRFVVGVDVNEEPAGGAVATGHISDQGIAARVVDWRPGSPRWIPAVVQDMIQTRTVEAVAAYLGGATREIAAELKAVCETEGVPLVDRQLRDVGADTRRLYDGLREQTTILEASHALAQSFDGARRRDIAESGLWVVAPARMSVDASPLQAAIFAHGVAAELATTPIAEFFIG